MTTAPGVLCKGCGVVKAKASMRITDEAKWRCVSCIRELEPRKQKLWVAK